MALIEVQWSGTGAAPDTKGGQHTNVATLWARFGNGPWRRARGVRSQHRLLRDIEKLLDLEPIGPDCDHEGCVDYVRCRLQRTPEEKP